MSEQPKPTVDPARPRSKPRSKWPRRVLFVTLSLGLVALIVIAFLPKPVDVEATVAERGAMVVTVDEDGRSRVKDRYVVSAPLTGNLARIELRAGDSVKQGDVLARLVPLAAPMLDARTRAEVQARINAAEASRRQVRSQIDRAKLATEFAKKEAERTRQLASQGAVGTSELDRAQLEERARAAELTSTEFAAKVADYEVSMARAALGALSTKRSDTEESMLVPSPLAGKVLKVLHESEGVVQAGTPLLELGDPAALELVVDVLTSDAVRISPGARASIERWGGPPLSARVRMIEPSAFTRLSALGVEEQRVNAVLDLDEPYEKWAPLMDGYRVEARIVIWQSSDVLRLPASALFRSEGKWAVFAIEDERAVLRSVEIGQNNGSEVELTGGLEPGARVVLHPSDRVKDGVQVTRR
ncbi:MAG: efflux RND transporter periplasmic adaptor subunit [Polyangiaceae bacterium]|nr:efflux RND transporter periplasmic adaptor subunit [Polyangiaceae bacterium]